MSSPEKTPGITPVGELFTYHIFGMPAGCRRHFDDPASYSLRVTGLVEAGLELSLDELRTDFEAVSAEMILQCMTNVHWGRIGITGARLADVIDRAGVADGAVKVALRGADGFASDLRLDEIRAEADAFLIAYAMNGEPLEPGHGYPVRMASDGRYGYKWPKWLTEVELVDYDFRGHYEGRRGWSDEGVRGEPVT